MAVCARARARVCVCKRQLSKSVQSEISSLYQKLPPQILLWWSRRAKTVEENAGGLGSISGQENRSHMLQLRSTILQLRLSY